MPFPNSASELIYSPSLSIPGGNCVERRLRFNRREASPYLKYCAVAVPRQEGEQITRGGLSVYNNGLWIPHRQMTAGNTSAYGGSMEGSYYYADNTKYAVFSENISEITAFPVLIHTRVRPTNDDLSCFASISKKTTAVISRISGWVDVTNNRLRLAVGAATHNFSKTISAGTWYDVIYYINASLNTYAYLDYDSSSSGGSVTFPATAPDTLLFNSQWYNGTQYYYDGGQWSFIAVYSGSSVTAGELFPYCKEFSRDPMQYFELD